MEIKAELIQTCGCCPEQYDLVNEQGELIAYFRLRHGAFRVDCYGKTVYKAEPDGDGMFGIEERGEYLHNALIAVKDYYGADRMEVKGFMEIVLGINTLGNN